MYNRDTAKSRGFGFVVFSEEAAVDRVLDGGTYHVIDDKDVEIKRSVPKSPAVLSSGGGASASTIPVPATSGVAASVATKQSSPPVAASSHSKPAVAPTRTGSGSGAGAVTKITSVSKGVAPPVAASAPVSKPVVLKASGTPVSWVGALMRGGSTSAQTVTPTAVAHGDTELPSEPAEGCVSEDSALAKASANPGATNTDIPQPGTGKAATDISPGSGLVQHHGHGTVSSLGLGLDLLPPAHSAPLSGSGRTGQSSLADLLRTSLEPSTSPTGGESILISPESEDIHVSSFALSGSQSRGQKGLMGDRGNVGIGMPLAGLFGFRPPHSASWDLTDGGGSAHDGTGAVFSGGESVVSTMTAEDTDGTDGTEGKRGRGKSGSSLVLGLSAGMPSTALPASSMPSLPPHFDPMALAYGSMGMPGGGASMFGGGPPLAAMYGGMYPSDPSAMLASAMAAAAISRMYQPWMGAGMPMGAIPPQGYPMMPMQHYPQAMHAPPPHMGPGGYSAPQSNGHPRATHAPLAPTHVSAPPGLGGGRTDSHQGPSPHYHGYRV